MKDKVSQRISIMFHLLFLIVIIHFCLTQIFFKDGASVHKPNIRILSEEAYYIKENGDRIQVTNKDIYFDRKNMENDQKINIEITLPEFSGDDICLALFTGNYDVTMKIDGKIVSYYNNQGKRKFGTYSPGKYIFLNLKESESEKKLLISYETTLSKMSSQLCAPVLGRIGEVHLWLIYRYIWQVISSVLLIALGVVFFAYSIIAYFSHRDGKGIHYLACFSILMSFWIMSQLDIRNYYMTNLDSVITMTSFCLMLLPLPMILFFNKIMEGTYKAIYNKLAIAAAANFFIYSTLAMLNVINLVEHLLVTRIIIVACCLVCIITFFMYAGRTKIEEPKAILLGMFGLTITTMAEISNMYFTHSFYLGKYIGFGILFFLLTLGYSAIRSMVAQEKEYNEALRANSEKTSFLANMSHEIRTPINTIMGMDEMILRENKDSNIQQYATNLHNAGKTLLSIINDILDFAKIDSGNGSLNLRRFSLTNLLTDLINTVKLRAEEKNVQFIIDIDDNIPSVLYGDDIRLKQAIANILTNAVKYTNKGKVEFKLSYEETSKEEINLIFSITDTGIGIKEEDMERIFESFVRLEPNRNRSIEGTGLGMAITKSIIDMMGGTIDVTSEYNKGSTFTVIINNIKFIEPTPIGPMSEWFKASARQRREYVEMYTAKEAKVLVVDDNEMNIEVIKGLLKNTGIKIDAALSGKECIEMMYGKTYDLIFLDHMMPGMNGVETLKYLREHKPFCDNMVPIVALTANAVAGAREAYLNYGFADYIAKPVEYARLVEVLSTFIPGKFHMKDDIQNITVDNFGFLEKNDIHVSKAFKYAGNDKEQYERLLVSFISDRGKKKREDMETAYANKDWDYYSIIVHGLKNSARTIGADSLADLAFEHEINSKQQNSCYIEENYDKILKEWSSVSKIIEDYFDIQETVDNNLDNEADSDIGEISDILWEEKIGQIIFCLETFKKKEALLILGDLSKHRLDMNRQQRLDQAIQAVQNYDYESAIEVLKEKI